MRLRVMSGAMGLTLLCAVGVHAANGTFAGFIRRDAGPGAASAATPSEVRGRWRVIGSQFSLEFPLTIYGHTSPTQVRIELVKWSGGLIQGLDQFKRPWEWRPLR